MAPMGLQGGRDSNDGDDGDDTDVWSQRPSRLMPMVASGVGSCCNHCIKDADTVS